jgi:hypothetical protein
MAKDEKRSGNILGVIRLPFSEALKVAIEILGSHAEGLY